MNLKFQVVVLVCFVQFYSIDNACLPLYAETSPVQGNEQCPHLNLMHDFNMERFAGTWYEIERFSHEVQNNLKCNRADYLSMSATSMRFCHSGINTTNGEFQVVTGSASIPDLREPAKLLFTVESLPVPNAPNYWVVESDYTSALVYSCRIEAGRKFEFSWIFSRRRTLDPATVNHLKRTLQSAGVDTNKFQPTDQINC